MNIWWLPSLKFLTLCGENLDVEADRTKHMFVYHVTLQGKIWYEKS